MSHDLELLGHRIAGLRGRMSQRELAKRARLDVSTVSRIERAVADPSYTTLRALAEAFGMTVTTLIEGLPGNAFTRQASGDGVGSPLVLSTVDLASALAQTIEEARTIGTALLVLLDHVEVPLDVRRSIREMIESRRSA